LDCLDFLELVEFKVFQALVLDLQVKLELIKTRLELGVVSKEAVLDADVFQFLKIVGHIGELVEQNRVVLDQSDLVEQAQFVVHTSPVDFQFLVGTLAHEHEADQLHNLLQQVH